MSFVENEVQSVLSYVVMENIIFPTVLILLGYLPVRDVGLFLVMIGCVPV
jgi:hypothetical protein